MSSPTSRGPTVVLLSSLVLLAAAVACGGAGDVGFFGAVGSASAGKNGGGAAGLVGAAAGSSASGGTPLTAGSANLGGAEAAGVSSGGTFSGGTSGTSSNGGASGGSNSGASGGPNRGGSSGTPNSGGSLAVAGSSGFMSAGGGAGMTNSVAGGPAVCDPHTDEVCDGVDNDCNGIIDDNACAPRCTGFVAAGKSYMACRTNNVQSRAMMTCEAADMRLVWITSAQQNSALLDALAHLDPIPGPEQGSIFIGASDAEQEAHWHWIGGANFWLGDSMGAPLNDAYANWALGRPNAGTRENCAVMLINSPSEGLPGQWNDAPCNELHGALCEKP